jgi:hypothetical protein
MKEKVHYEEDLFCLSIRIKAIKQQLQLSINPQYFMEQIAKELLFIHNTLQQIYEELSQNSFLINRKLYLYSLIKVKGSIISLFDNYLENQDLKNSSNDSMLEQVYKAKEISENDLGDIKSILSDHNNKDSERDLISIEEINFLMAPGLNSEED